MASRSLTPRVSLALFALVGQLSSYAHLAAVQHVTCEHGDYVELQHDDDASAAHFDHRDLVAANADDHEHDHCAATPNVRHGSLLVDSSRAPVANVFAFTLTSLPASPNATASIPLHRLAPKNSPPSA